MGMLRPFKFITKISMILKLCLKKVKTEVWVSRTLKQRFFIIKIILVKLNKGKKQRFEKEGQQNSKK